MAAALRRVLVCGHRAQAAQGLAAALAAAGCEVWETSRGPAARRGRVVTGPLAGLAENPCLPASLDTVVNYVVLAGEDVAANHVYAEALLRLCTTRRVRHLIQISSLSVVRDNVRRVDEASPVKTDPGHSGSYAAAKIVAEQTLRHSRPPELGLSLVRPGRILTAEMDDPARGLTLRLGPHTILLLGRPDRIQPLITREALNAGLARLVAAPPDGVEVILAVDPRSPTAQTYVRRVTALRRPMDRLLPAPLPLTALVRAARELRRGPDAATVPRLRGGLFEDTQLRRYDPSCSEARLGVSFASEWQDVLAAGAAGRSGYAEAAP